MARRGRPRAQRKRTLRLAGGTQGKGGSEQPGRSPPPPARRDTGGAECSWLGRQRFTPSHTQKSPNGLQPTLALPHRERLSLVRRENQEGVLNFRQTLPHLPETTTTVLLPRPGSAGSAAPAPRDQRFWSRNTCLWSRIAQPFLQGRKSQPHFPAGQKPRTAPQPVVSFPPSAHTTSGVIWAAHTPEPQHLA